MNVVSRQTGRSLWTRTKEQCTAKHHVLFVANLFHKRAWKFTSIHSMSKRKRSLLCAKRVARVLAWKRGFKSITIFILVNVPTNAIYVKRHLILLAICTCIDEVLILDTSEQNEFPLGPLLTCLWTLLWKWMLIFGLIKCVPNWDNLGLWQICARNSFAYQMLSFIYTISLLR